MAAKKSKAKSSAKSKKPSPAKKKSVAAKKSTKTSQPVAKAASNKPAVHKPKLAAVPTNFTPLDDRLVVRVDPAAERTSGGIIIPGTMSERPTTGTVVASGRDHRNKKGKLRPLDVATGDQILFSEYAGTKVQIGSEELLILREEDVLGIVT